MSTVNPIEAAMAPIVMILKSKPINVIVMNVRASVSGIVISITALAFIERRKIITTTIASSSPIHRTSIILLMLLLTNSAWL